MTPLSFPFTVLLFLLSSTSSLAGVIENALCVAALTTAGCDVSSETICDGECLSLLTSDTNCKDIYNGGCAVLLAGQQCTETCYTPSEANPVPVQGQMCSSSCTALWGTCASSWSSTAEVVSPLLTDCCTKSAEEWLPCIMPLLVPDDNSDNDATNNTTNDTTTAAPTAVTNDTTFAVPTSSPTETPAGDGTCTMECFGYEEFNTGILLVPCLEYLTTQTLTKTCLGAALPSEPLACSEGCQGALTGCTDVFMPYIDIVEDSWTGCCGDADAWVDCLYDIFLATQPAPTTASPTTAPTSTPTQIVSSVDLPGNITSTASAIVIKLVFYMIAAIGLMNY
mmetsp:Transcript_15885/g.21931  ORF Transcript_15885/g.21931 Transcript_15885/m.21931 type:complete len:338 (-) Transcript_15885:98-1111(-)